MIKRQDAAYQHFLNAEYWTARTQSHIRTAEDHKNKDWDVLGQLPSVQVKQLDEFFDFMPVTSYVAQVLGQIREGHKLETSKVLVASEKRATHSAAADIKRAKIKWLDLPEGHHRRADFALKREMLESITSLLEAEAPEVLEGFLKYEARMRDSLRTETAKKNFSALNHLLHQWPLSVCGALEALELSMEAPDVRESMQKAGAGAKQEHIAARRSTLLAIAHLWEQELELPLQKYDGKLFFEFLQLVLPFIGIHCDSKTIENDLQKII